MSYSREFVRPLRLAENTFLQVLLTKFSLRRNGSGAHLDVGFSSDTDTIWTRQAKDYLRTRPTFAKRAAFHRKRIDAVLLEQTRKALRFHDEKFPFRYSNGGALPVLRMGGREFYCLFYRDIHPIGWNIANGGSDSRAELLNPLGTIERELREELIIVNPKRRLRYVFRWEALDPEDRAEFALARRIWGQAFPRQDLTRFEPVRLPLKWLEGPDTLTVEMQGNPPVQISGCWLNVTPDDFGIEVDKVARMNVDEDAVLLDGELLGDIVLDRPVGLFEVDHMDRLLRQGATQFVPDVFFHHGVKHPGKNFERTIAGPFTRSLKDIRTRAEQQAFTSCAHKIDLCPVTRAILVRTAGLPKQAPLPVRAPRADQRPDVFISCGRGDEHLARRIYEFVTNTMGRSAFFYEEDRRSDYWGRRIDDALAAAKYLIVAGTDSRRINRRWPQYEWGSFHDAMLSGRKPRTARLIPFIVGMRPQSLPWALQSRKMVVCDEPRSGLRELGTLL